MATTTSTFTVATHGIAQDSWASATAPPTAWPTPSTFITGPTGTALKLRRDGISNGPVGMLWANITIPFFRFNVSGIEQGKFIDSAYLVLDGKKADPNTPNFAMQVKARDLSDAPWPTNIGQVFGSPNSSGLIAPLVNTTNTTTWTNTGTYTQHDINVTAVVRVLVDSYDYTTAKNMLFFLDKVKTYKDYYDFTGPPQKINQINPAGTMELRIIFTDPPGGDWPWFFTKWGWGWGWCGTVFPFNLPAVSEPAEFINVTGYRGIKAFSFSVGQGDYFSNPDHDKYDFPAEASATFNVWFRPLQIGSRQVLYQKTDSYVLEYTSDNKIKFTAYGGPGQTPSVSATTVGTFTSVNAWHHVAVVFHSGGYPEIYHDGYLESVTTGGTPFSSIHSSSSDFLIGTATAPSVSDNYEGYLDDIFAAGKEFGLDRIEKLSLRRNYVEIPMGGPEGIGDEWGWWVPSLDDDGDGTTVLHDYSDNGIAGEIENGPTWVVDTGAGGSRAIEFDGIDDRVWLDQVNYTHVRSIAAWFYADTAGENSRGTIVDNYAVGSDGFRLAIQSAGGPTDAIEFSAGRPTTDGVFVTNDSAVTYGAWNHVAVIHHADGSGSIYLNGVLQTLQTDTSSAGDPQIVVSDTIIGNNPADDRAFDGKLDDIRFYQRELSNAEVAVFLSSKRAWVRADGDTYDHYARTPRKAENKIV